MACSKRVRCSAARRCNSTSVIEEHAEMPGPVDQAGQINPVLVAVRPSNVEGPGRPRNADGLDAGEAVHWLISYHVHHVHCLISIEVFPLRHQSGAFGCDPGQCFSAMASRYRPGNQSGAPAGGVPRLTVKSRLRVMAVQIHRRFSGLSPARHGAHP
jgi:hypothetical protein